MFSATDIIGDAGVAQRLLGQAAHPEAAHLAARGAVGLAAHTSDLAGARRALAGQHLDQLALPVARHAGDADDLSGAHVQRQPR